MEQMDSDKALSAGDPPIWTTYHEVVHQRAGTAVDFERIERFAFYERAKTAFAVVGSTEGAMYGNLILRKGTLAADLDPQAHGWLNGEQGGAAAHSNMTR
jgi:L-fucose mutarotase